MCPESLAHHARGRDAEVGDRVVIKDFQEYQHHFTMFARTSTPTCPICLPEGSTVKFTNLPLNIQKRTGTGPEATAFLQNGASVFSTFEFPNGATATLSELKGVEFEVVPCIDLIDQEANKVIAEVAMMERNQVTPEVVTASRTRSAAAGVGALALALLVALIIG